MNFNQIILIGRIGQVSNRSFNNQSVIKLTIATSEYKKLDNGQFEEITEWNNVDYWLPANSDRIDKFQKGRLIQVIGKLLTNKYTKNGEDVHFKYIKADRINFLDRLDNANSAQVPTPPPSRQDEDDSDLPF